MPAGAGEAACVWACATLVAAVKAATIAKPVRSSVRSFMGQSFLFVGRGELATASRLRTNSRGAGAYKAGVGLTGPFGISRQFSDRFRSDGVQRPRCFLNVRKRTISTRSTEPIDRSSVRWLVLPAAGCLSLITWKHSYEVLQIVGFCPHVGRSHPRLSDRAGAGPAFGRCERRDRAAAASLLRAADHSGRGLYLGAWLLGLGCQRRRLLLGTWLLGGSAAARIAVDASLLGLGRGPLRLPARLLGPGSRLLRRHRLRLRLYRRRLLRRSLGPWRILLQPRGQQHHECEDHQRLQPDGGREQRGQSREFQRWEWRHGSAADTAAGNLCTRAACRGDAGTASARRGRRQGPRVVLETESRRACGRGHRAPRCHAG